MSVPIENPYFLLVTRGNIAYTVHLRLIEKLIVDFLFVLAELFR